MASDPFGIALAIGTVANATFNAAVAGTVEYDEKCKDALTIDNHVKGVNDAADKIQAAYKDATQDFFKSINDLKSKLALVKKAHAQAKVKMQKQIERTQLASKIFTSMITLILTMKYLLRNF